MNLIGYRNEDISGLGYRSISEVTDFEMIEMENNDIQDHLKVNSIAEAQDYIFELKKRGYVGCLWVCESTEALKYSYQEKLLDLNEIEVHEFKFSKEDIVLADNEEEGQLIAYKEEPELIKVFSISVV